MITGERGHREIVRPLKAIGVQLEIIDWEKICQAGRFPHARFLIELWTLLCGGNHGFTHVFTDMSSVFLATILGLAKPRNATVLMRLRGDLFAESRDQIRFHFRHCQWAPLARGMMSLGLDRLLFRFVDRYVPVSHWIVRRLGIHAKSSVVRIPCDPAAFNRRIHSGSSLRLLAVTNFNYPQKVAPMGLFFERSATFLRKHGIEISVAGTGIALAQFRARYGKEIDFLGHVAGIGSLYARHDAFIHFSGLDAFPYVVLEAQASGLPVMVNNDCGMLEQVEEGITGLIVDLDLQTEVEQKLLALKESPGLREQLGAAGVDSIAASYSLKKIGHDLQAALES
ncbi:MAG: glycosyltransferase family 4 protein [Chthoniobacteraceae bacterium]|nr:glycosyltransferase family 4 protein [Chthoniobacteraceae bacterium]